MRKLLSFVRAQLSRILAAIAICCLILLWAGCTGLKQYRTAVRAFDATLSGAECAACSIELTTNYLLGLVEFDDQGWLWSRKQMDAVLDRLASEDSTNGLLIMVYVHGWNHNASWDDDNVAMFRTNLTELAEMERQLSRDGGWRPRTVAGVYVGWRGLSSNIGLFSRLSFWDRKNTAHEVGRGAVTEFYGRLEDLRNNSRVRHAHETRRKQTQLIIIGHSLGGALTYSALAPLLVERSVQSSTNQSVGQVKGFGDLVVLVNPAFEAARFEVLYNITTNRHWYATNQPVNLVIFTSKADTATKFWFKLGRRSSTLWEKYRDRDQKNANITAIGHDGPFITHDLVYLTNNPLFAPPPPSRTATPKSLPKPGGNPRVKSKAYTGHLTVSNSVAQVRSLQVQIERHRSSTKEQMPDRSYGFSHARLVPREDHGKPILHMPVFNVSVDKQIIPDHGAIDTQEFLTILREFVAAFTAQGSESPK